MKNAQTVIYPDSVVPAGRSFCLRVDFTAPMAAQIGGDSLRLIDQTGNALPVHAQWSADRKSLFAEAPGLLGRYGLPSAVCEGSAR